MLSRAGGRHRNLHKAYTAGSWLAGGICRRWIFADNAKVIVTAADCKPSVVKSEPSRELRKRRGKESHRETLLGTKQPTAERCFRVFMLQLLTGSTVHGH